MLSNVNTVVYFYNLLQFGVIIFNFCHLKTCWQTLRKKTKK